MSNTEDHDGHEAHDNANDAIRDGGEMRGHRHRIQFAIDGLAYRLVTLDDPVPLGRQILDAADANGECALFAITERGDFEDVRPDEKVDLRERGAHRFVAFSSDRLYRFTLADRAIVWGLPKIAEDALRSLAGIDDDVGVFIEVDGGTDILIEPGTELDLSQQGVERLITAKRRPKYRFLVNGKPFESDKKKLTGAQIKAMVPDWDATHDLSLEGEGDDPDRIIPDDETISLDPKHGTRRFSSVPKANFG